MAVVSPGSAPETMLTRINAGQPRFQCRGYQPTALAPNSGRRDQGPVSSASLRRRLDPPPHPHLGTPDRLLTPQAASLPNFVERRALAGLVVGVL